MKFFSADLTDYHLVGAQVTSLVDPQRVGAFEFEMADLALVISLLNVLVFVPV